MTKNSVGHWVDSFFDWLRDPDGKNRQKFVAMDQRIKHLEQVNLGLDKQISEKLREVETLQSERTKLQSERTKLERELQALKKESNVNLSPTNSGKGSNPQGQKRIAWRTVWFFLLALLVLGACAFVLWQKKEGLAAASDVYTVLGVLPALASLLVLCYKAARSDAPKVPWRWNFKFWTWWKPKKGDWLEVLNTSGLVGSILGFAVFLMLKIAPKIEYTTYGSGSYYLYY